MRSNIRPEARIQGVITEGGAAPNVVPDRTVGRLLHPLSRRGLPRAGRRVGRQRGEGGGARDRHEGEDRSLRQGSSTASASATLGEVGLRVHEEVRRAPTSAPSRASRRDTRRRAASRATSPASASARRRRTLPNHTYEMDADNLKEIGHHGFTVDAQTMAALLFDFATHADYRAAVKKEFDGIKALFGEYQDGAEEGVRAAEGAGSEIGIRVRAPGAFQGTGAQRASTSRRASFVQTRSAGQSTCGPRIRVAERADRNRVQQLVRRTGTRPATADGTQAAASPRPASVRRRRNRSLRLRAPRRARCAERAIGHQVDQFVPDRPLEDTRDRAAPQAAAGAARGSRRRLT